MASFKDYEAEKTASVSLFHGESLKVRSGSSAEFLAAALPFYREREKANNDKANNDKANNDNDDTRFNLAMAFALVESWTFEDELTLENFIEMLESPAYAPIAADICKNIDRAAFSMDNFVKKKSKD